MPNAREAPRKGSAGTGFWSWAPGSRVAAYLRKAFGVQREDGESGNGRDL